MFMFPSFGFNGKNPLSGEIAASARTLQTKHRMLCFYTRSRVSVLCLVMLVMSGCGGGLHMIHEGNRKGVMTYLYKGSNGHMLTPRRAEAFQEIRKFCQSPFDVVREGKTLSLIHI